MRELYYKICFRIEGRYYADGIVKIVNDSFEGILTGDYVQGHLANGSLVVNLTKFDLQNVPREELAFFTSIEDFELPNNFSLSPADTHNGYANISFIKKLSISKADFENSLIAVKKNFSL